MVSDFSVRQLVHTARSSQISVLPKLVTARVERWPA
jgi:hypothetical protein